MTKDGTSTCNIQELNHKHLPIRKNNVVESIGFCHSWRHTIVRGNDPLYKASVEQITKNQSNEAQSK